jgi:class 3 adenylate cyclase/tetratricopeptide (TPR) repeat protein
MVDWLRNSPNEKVREIEGTLAFADISGFTKLTERLSRLGRVGAEEMSDTLNRTFGGLLAVAYTDGAQLLKWGGDAVLLLFDGEDHATRACHAAFGMRAAIRELGRVETTAGGVQLRMSTGIHSGTFHLFLIGNPEHHRELMVCGPGVSATARMESQAGSAGIAMTEQTAARIAPQLVARTGEALLLRAEPTVAHRYSRQSADVTGLDLAQCLPRPIREHLLAAAGESEHRNTSVAFLGFSGTDGMLESHGALALAEALDDLVRNVQDAAARHGATFFESDIDVGGGKLMLTAGTPTSAGHDEDRMLRTARLILDRAGTLPLRIGVNRGNVFAGDFGPPYRRTYSIKGDAVNVAARLMGKASAGQIIAAAAVVERSSAAFESRKLEPLALKGKTAPVQAFEVGQLATGQQIARSSAQLIGRESELSLLLDTWGRARLGQGCLVDIVGEPGIGKSTLVAEFVRRAEGATVFRGQADPYESSTPYFVWKRLLRELVGLAATSAQQDDITLLTRRFEELAPDLLPWLPLAAVPMGIHAEPTEVTKDLDAEFRKARLEEVTARLVVRALAAPTLLVMDDVHLLDEPSAGLLQRIREGASQERLMIVVTRRDQASGFVPPAGPEVTRLNLGPLDAAASVELITGAAGETALRPDEMAALARRAAGNPLFLRELVVAAAGRGSLAGLPDSIEGVITTQIDRLTPRDRTILRYAAVLGTSFTWRLLRAMLSGQREIEMENSLPAALDAFISVESADAFRFRHALIRDAAYEGLPYRSRRELHGRAGAAIEGAAGSPDEQAELLSMHYFHSGRLDSAWRYSVIAGDRARAKYANPEAADFYARAVDVANRMPSVALDELARVQESLGDVRYLVGQSRAAVGAYREASALSRGLPVKEAELVRKVARIQVRLGNFPQALRLLTQGRSLLGDGDNGAATAMRAILASEYALCRYRQGRLADAMRWARTAATEGEASGDRTARARAYQALYTIHRMSGLTPDRPYDQLALSLYEELGDLATQAQMLNNMAIGSIFDGRWGEALEMFRRARATYERVGDTTLAGSAGHNMGELLTAQGRIEEAEPILRESMRVARSVGDREAVAGDIKELGRGAARRGRFEEAIRLLEEARAEAAGMGAAHEVADTEAAIAECRLLAGEPSAALAQTAVALEHAQQAGATRVLPTLARIRGFALMQLDVEAGAESAFDDARRLSSEPGTQHECAFALAGLSQLADRMGAHERARTLMAESQKMLFSLGVVSAPIFAEVDVPIVEEAAAG